MDKLTKFALFLVSCAALSACSQSLSKEIDEYFKGFAIENYNNGSAIFYRSLQPNEEQRFYTFDDGAYTNVITGLTIESNKKLIERHITGSSEPYYSLEGDNDELYDCLGNSVDVDSSFEAFDIQTAFVSTSNKAYKDLFGEEKADNQIELVEMTQLGGKCFVRKYGESFFDFGHPISNEHFAAFYTVDRPADYYVRTNKYEYAYTSKKVTEYYYVDKNSAYVNSTSVSERFVESGYICCFDYEFQNLEYYYYVKRLDTITNDFDFYLTEDYIRTFGIGLSVGYYKVYSSHNPTYFPLSIRISAKHDYAYSLCLKIGNNKTLDPQYYVVKLQNGKKPSAFSNDVELFISEKDYIKLKNDYVLLDYSSLIYLDGKRSYYIDRGANRDYCLHFGDQIVYVEQDISYITTINDGDDIRSLFVDNGESKTIYVYGNNGYRQQIAYDKLFDGRNLLYTASGKLFFQTFEIGVASKNDSISSVYEENLTSCGRTYKVIEYHNNTKDTYHQIVCKDGNHE